MSGDGVPSDGDLEAPFGDSEAPPSPAFGLSLAPGAWEDSSGAGVPPGSGDDSESGAPLSSSFVDSELVNRGFGVRLNLRWTHTNVTPLLLKKVVAEIYIMKQIGKLIFV